jgi:hypothetical protein
MDEAKDALHAKLVEVRAALLAAVEGASEHDLRRPMTPTGADMWATAEESSDEIIALYRRACAHGDATIASLDLDAPGRVPHWDPATADTTLGYLLVRMVAETAQHAGHAEILRETIDGRTGSDTGDSGTDWPTYVRRIQAAADHFTD